MTRRQRIQTSCLISLSLLALGGCESLSKLIPYGQLANEIKSAIAVKVAGTYTVQVLKNGEVIHSKSWVCTGSQGEIPECKEVKLNDIPAN